MQNNPDTQFLQDRLAAQPFNLQITSVQLLNDMDARELFQLLSKVLNYINDGRTELRTEESILSFLKLLRYPASDESTVETKFLEGDRITLLNIVEYLLKNEDLLKKRAYLAPFLTPVSIPDDFFQDDVIQQLQLEYQQLQEQFKLVHKRFDQIMEKNATEVEMKKHIKSLEDEKIQITSEINRKRSKLETIPKFEIWIEAARRLRIEQTNEADIREKQKLVKKEIADLENKIEMLKLNVSSTKSMWSAGPETLIRKLQEEVKLNKILATEKIPKTVNERKTEISMLKTLLAREDVVSKDECSSLERQIKEWSDKIKSLSQTKLGSQDLSDEKMVLLRQQASSIANKKFALSDKLAALMEKTSLLNQDLSRAQVLLENQQGPKVPKKDHLKQYLLDVKNNAAAFREKKKVLAELNNELVILENTRNILTERIKTSEVNVNQGADVDRLNQELSRLNQDISEKKNSLAPLVQDLRKRRENLAELDYLYQDKKRQYDAVMMSIETENITLAHELKSINNEITDLESQSNLRSAQLLLLEVTQDKVLNEMKAYVGGDPDLEIIQKRRGFITYRELYQKKISDLDLQSKQMREKLADLQNTVEPSIKQQALLKDLISIVQLKVEMAIRTNERRSSIEIQEKETEKKIKKFFMENLSAGAVLRELISGGPDSDQAILESLSDSIPLVGIEREGTPAATIFLKYMTEFFAVLINSPFDVAQILLQLQYLPKRTESGVDINQYISGANDDDSEEFESWFGRGIDVDADNLEEGNSFDASDSSDVLSSNDDNYDNYRYRDRESRPREHPESYSFTRNEIQDSEDDGFDIDEHGYITPSTVFSADYSSRYPYQLPEMRGGVRSAIKTITKHPRLGPLSLWRGAVYRVLFEVGRKKLQPIIEDFMNERFDLYDLSVIPFRLQSSFLPNFTTLILSHGLADTLLMPIEYIRIRSIAAPPGKSTFPTLPATITPVSLVKWLYPQISVASIYFSLVPLLQNGTHLILSRFLRLSIAREPLRYALALFGLTCLEHLVTMPIETVLRRLWVHGPSAEGIISQDGRQKSCIRMRPSVYLSFGDCLTSILNEEALGYEENTIAKPVGIGRQSRTRSRPRRRKRKQSSRNGDTILDGYMGSIAQLYRGFWFNMIQNSLICLVAALSGVDRSNVGGELYF